MAFSTSKIHIAFGRVAVLRFKSIRNSPDVNACADPGIFVSGGTESSDNVFLLIRSVTHFTEGVQWFISRKTRPSRFFIC